MYKLLKRIVSFAVVLIAALSLTFHTGAFTSAQAATNEILDVYLIAGQSNAVGLSPTSSLTCDSDKLQEYTTGYSNVLYRGHGDSVNVEAYDAIVKTGLGSTSGHIGSELGIAEVISENNEQRTSLILKRAVGGSYLVDDQSLDVSRNNGNWCPPSMRDENAFALTGKLYDEFVALIEESVEYYKEQGYTVLLKGTFWMQGEAETDGKTTTEKYVTHLTALINDLRSDLEGVFDNYAASAPFVIGKIAPTFNGGGNGYVETIRAAQDTVAATLSRVYKVETDDYVIVDPTTGQPASGCPDRYHFCGDDIVSIGRDVANVFLENNQAAVEVFTDGNGSSDVTYKAMDGNPTTVTFKPNPHFSIGKLTENGVDVTDRMQGNTYTVTTVDGYVYLEIVFDEEPKYTVSLSYDRDRASIQKSKASYFYYAGEVLTLKILPKTGYEIESVTFDGQAVQANAEGEYEIAVTSGDNVFAVTFKKEQGGSTVQKPSVEYVSGGGCSASVGNVSVGVLLAGAAIATILKKKQG